MSRNSNARVGGASLRRVIATTALTLLALLLPLSVDAQSNRARQQSAPRAQVPQQSRPVQPRTQSQPRLQQQPPMRQQSPVQQRQLLPQQNRLIPQQIVPQQNRQLLPQQRELENRTAPARPAYNGMFPQNQTQPRPGVNSFRPGIAVPPQYQQQPVQQPVPNNREPIRPALPPAPTSSTSYPAVSRPGHLGSWLNQHGNLPVQGQEQILRSDPNFKKLPQSDQQRLVQQLQQVNQLPEQERQRRLARAETIERMNPQERMQLNQSTRQLSNLPPDRQNVVKRAFRDLRGVPLDQRQTVLNSQRYQGQFTPEERGILTNLLRAEPYQPQ